MCLVLHIKLLQRKMQNSRNSIATEPSTTEYSGFNTRNVRGRSKKIEKKTCSCIYSTHWSKTIWPYNNLHSNGWNREDHSLSEEFNTKISSQITTMKSARKSVRSGDIQIFNTEVIYSRVMCLLSIGRVKLEEVLRFELSPKPLSIFQTNGEMRPSKSKSDLKTVLQVTTFQRNQSKSEVIIVDGCAKFWDITWPKNGTVRDLDYQMY